MDRRERIIEAGKWLRAERDRRNIRMRDLADAIDVAPQTISNYETGKNEIDDERAEQIARALGMDIIEVRRGLRMWTPADDWVEQLADQTLAYDLDAIRANAVELIEQIDEVISRHVGDPDQAAERATRRRDLAQRGDDDHERLRQGIAAQAEDLRTELDEPSEDDTDQAL